MNRILERMSDQAALIIFLTYFTLGMPAGVKSVVRSTAFEGDARGPSMQSVVEVLKERGIIVEAMKIQVPHFLI